jgi:LysR family hca operon transcriptional activator
LRENGIEISPSYEVDNLGGVMSLIASTGGVALLPVYAKTFLPNAVVTRPLEGVGPKIDLSIGYRRANSSSILKLFLSRVDELTREQSLQLAAD